MKTTVLAGGCFWGVEELFLKQIGVSQTRVGYCGGHLPNPTYDDVKTGNTGHAESIEVQFDPQKTSYKNIFRFFFSIHDPTTPNQQGNDRGSQYRSAIFYQSDEEREAAEQVLSEVQSLGFWKKPIITELISFEKFYAAEDFHQKYLQKNPGGYTCHFQRYPVGK